MRVDKFLNSTNVVKTRSLAQDMCESGAVLVNGARAKPSRDVKVGDVVTLVFLERERKFEVLDFPRTKSVPKAQSGLYVREV